ncbi:MAG: hypothetical protein ACLFRZ_07165 [Rhodosalinus sp.]
MSIVSEDGAARHGLSSRPLLISALAAALLLVLLATAEFLFFGTGYYRALTLHPFWVVILLAAVQHGVPVGLVTVGVATALVGWPDRPLGMQATTYFAQSAILPLQWLTVALIVGLYRERQITETEALKAENTKLSRMNDTLAGEVERMDSMLETLERSAASGTGTQVHTSDGLEEVLRGNLPVLADLAGAPGDELPEAFARAAQAVLDAPAVLALREAGEAPLIIGELPEGIGAGDVASVLNMIDVQDGPEIVSGAGAGFSDDFLVLARARAQAEEKELLSAVLAFPRTVAQAEAEAPLLDLLAEMSRLSIDRLSHSLADPPTFEPAGQAA